MYGLIEIYMCLVCIYILILPLWVITCLGVSLSQPACYMWFWHMNTWQKWNQYQFHYCTTHAARQHSPWHCVQAEQECAVWDHTKPYIFLKTHHIFLAYTIGELKHTFFCMYWCFDVFETIENVSILRQSRRVRG